MRGCALLGGDESQEALAKVQQEIVDLGGSQRQAAAGLRFKGGERRCELAEAAKRPWSLLREQALFLHGELAGAPQEWVVVGQCGCRELRPLLADLAIHRGGLGERWSPHDVGSLVEELGVDRSEGAAARAV